MNHFKVYYSGACVESGESREEVEEKVHNKIASTGQVFETEAIALHPDDRDFNQGNYIVSFEGEMTVQAEKKIGRKPGLSSIISFRTDHGSGF